MNSPVATNIKNLREARAWTQEQLAGVACIDVRTIQRAERGQPLGAESLQAIATALDVGIDELRRDHAAEAADAYLQRFDRVILRQVEGCAALMSAVSTAKALLVRPSSEALAVKHARELAEVEAMLIDIVDLVGDVPPTHLLDMVEELDPVIGRLRQAGVVIGVGTYKAPYGPLELDTMVFFASEERAELVFIEKPPRDQTGTAGGAQN